MGMWRHRSALGALFGMTIVLCSPTSALACSVEASTEIIVNHLKGNIRLNGNMRSGTVELQQAARRGNKTLRTVAISDHGDFDLGLLAAGKFRLKIRVDDHVLFLPVLVKHLREKGGSPTTFMDADLHYPVGTDCKLGHWTFDSHLVAGNEE
jgi:hypothetical protein